jgi:putative transposase
MAYTPRGDAYPHLGGGLVSSPSCPHADVQGLVLYPIPGLSSEDSSIASSDGGRKALTRTNVVRLVVNRDVERKLRELAKYTAKAWNEVNWLRMQQFRERIKVNFNETERAVYHKYKQYLKVNAQQVCRKNAEAWRSFFSLAKEKREGKIPKWQRPRPPGYWRDKKVILIRNDRYVVDEAAQTIYLKDFGLALKLRGRLKWRGKQGRLEIFHDGLHWYAAIPVEFEHEVKPKGNGSAGIDLGIANLAVVAFQDGTWMLFKGGAVRADYEGYSKKIAKHQKRLARHKRRGSKRLRRYHAKRRRYLKHVLNSMVRCIVEMAYEKGVRKIFVGYPKEIAQRHGNKLTVNFWSYNYVIRRMQEVGEEYGVVVVPVDESYTSQRCSTCGEIHPNGRIHRGLYKCSTTNQVINADLNGALNMLKHSPESLGLRRGGNSARGIGVMGAEGPARGLPLDERSWVGSVTTIH